MDQGDDTFLHITLGVFKFDSNLYNQMFAPVQEREPAQLQMYSSSFSLRALQKSPVCTAGVAGMRKEREGKGSSLQHNLRGRSGVALPIFNVLSKS